MDWIILDQDMSKWRALIKFCGERLYQMKNYWLLKGSVLLGVRNLQTMFKDNKGQNNGFQEILVYLKSNDIIIHTELAGTDIMSLPSFYL